MSRLFNHPYLLFLRYLFAQFRHNQGILNSAALTYTTLFAVVPLMTVSYAMLAAVPSFQGVGQELQGWVFQNFVPTTGAVVQDYLTDFSSQARKLTAVGIAVLAVTSIMMMKNIEAAFNRIWRVSEPRKGLSSFLLYWAILSLGPILIGLGLLLTSYIASLPFISSATELVGRGRLLSLLPTLFSAAAFTLIYVAVPNCRVPFKSALIGGVVVALLFETAKRGFAAFVTQFPSYELIYGAFAAVPLFLLWIFISWVIILMGAELTRCITVYRPMDKGKKIPHLYTVVAVLYRLWKAQNEGVAVTDRCLLQEVDTLDQGRWDTYIRLLIEEGVIKRSDQGEYLLSRSMSSLSLYELNDLLPWPTPAPLKNDSVLEWERALNQRLQEVHHIEKNTFSVYMEQLFNGDLVVDSTGDNETHKEV
ncbi:YihY family inner membrane protein [Neptuniibacter sp. 2_MG-2023]|jgi:membrane protein|uniref:YihY family inner membrane protein n=1 Tax=Neptuniibacter sp. 2_MG-2023 TaxID=3062671 RepID=UPI0026E3CBD3|nr:YihY family inner membrane protein [Neptuniibacter sp. 2_MG-2023]MDO6513388.1 YihY family inner membrane protein [Neptuniibacter sp. 2_MG-2023]